MDQALLNFIRGWIPSVWAVELLMLLRGAGGPLCVDEMVRELRANPTLVRQISAGLEVGGVVQSGEPDCFTYAPASAQIAALCDQLESAWRETPVAVMKAIASAPNDKLQTFADAFRWKGDKG